jgi:Lon protease-like protein
MDEVFAVPNKVPVFPHPEVVLFPRAVLPLHMYEPRYRQMITDALAGDRIIAAALLKPGCCAA